MKQAFLVRIMWRKKGSRKFRKIWAADITEARSLAFQMFGVNRGVRPVEDPHTSEQKESSPIQ